MKRYKRLKDPIYGYIQVPVNYMSGIVDSAVFQRLRRIIQTSYSPLYSSAVHNRFVHSLGVYHLGTIASETLCHEIREFGPKISEEQLEQTEQIFLLACLLHDVGHAPFSHTGEKLYLDGDGETRYHKIHNELVKEVGTEEFSKDIPSNSNVAAAPHEIMSAIVGIRKFSEYMPSPEKKEFFARCITGYKYSVESPENAIKNCFILLLNSKVIDVDKMDYLIRDAYITGFNTVSLDYIRLLKAITIKSDESEMNYQIAYYKDAISVIENVVYAHDAERKWIQNHPIVLYECYILNHIFQYLNDCLNIGEQKIFSYDSLMPEGQILKDNVKVSLLCDDDIVYIMKNVCKTKLSEEYFQRSNRRHPIWKSEAEYEALFSQAMGGKNDSMNAFEHAMQATASYLTCTSDTWMIDESTIEKLKKDIDTLSGKDVDELTRKVQLKDKKAALKLMSCLLDFADKYKLEHDFVIIEASQFNSGFAKPDFSKTPVIFNSSKDEIINTDFATVAKPLQSNRPERNKFYYLFYRRTDEMEEIDKAELCRYLANTFTTLSTQKRIRKE